MKANIIKVERVMRNDYYNFKVTYQSGVVRHYEIHQVPKTVAEYIRANGYIKVETKTEKVEVEGKKFQVGGIAVQIDGRYEKVLKRTNCYVWVTYAKIEAEAMKLKIRKSMGNEYVEYYVPGQVRGQSHTVRLWAA